MLGLALLTPAVSFGPLFQSATSSHAVARGRRLVDENGRPYKASDIEEDDFYLAFPEGERRGEGADGGLARPDPAAAGPASTCRRDLRATTRTGSSPTRGSAPMRAARSRSTGRRSSSPTSRGPRSSAPATTRRSTPRPAAPSPSGRRGGTCRCCRSTIDRSGYLRAKGNFDEPVGPSWWGVRLWKAQP